MRHLIWILLGTLFLPLCAQAKTIVVPMYLVAQNGTGESVGDVTIRSATQGGVVFTPHLHGLTPGVHGFHIHQKPSCDDLGMAAGDHLDPTKTNKHEGPFKDGHLGDLPTIFVADDGTSTASQLASRLSMADLSDHALMIHKGGDNYSDIPEKNGGGGARMVCGVIR